MKSIPSYSLRLLTPPRPLCLAGSVSATVTFISAVPNVSFRWDFLGSKLNIRMAANRNIIIKIKKTDSDGHIEYQSTLTAIALSTTDAASGNQIVEWPGDSVTIAKYK